jgi:DNA-binding response OmpR family regulator
MRALLVEDDPTIAEFVARSATSRSSRASLATMRPVVRK